MKIPKQVRILVDDTHANPDFRRYVKGDTARVVKYVARLFGTRKWHYSVVLDKTQELHERRLSAAAYFTKDEVEVIR